MEKRRNNTLDRWQRLGFGRRTSSNSSDNKPSAKESKRPNEKTERLKELTEKLKRTRTNPTQSSDNDTQSPPPIPPPRKQRPFAESTSASCTSLNTIIKMDRLNDMESVCESIDEKHDEPLSANSGFLFCTPIALKEMPKMLISEETPETDEKIVQPSINSSDEITEQPTLNEESILQAENEDDMFMALPKVESRTIIGAYTQKNIPYRSASFSQVDYSSGKYIRSAINAFKSNLKSKSPAVVDNTNLTLPRKRDAASNQENSSSSSAMNTTIDQENFTEEPLQFGNDFLPNDIVQKKTVSDDIIEESEQELLHSDGISFPDDDHNDDNATSKQMTIIELNVVQASEMILDQLCEEEAAISSSPNIDVFQTATTCLIPVPVYECVPQEWDPNDTPDLPEWINACEEEGTKIIEEMQINFQQISNDLNDSVSKQEELNKNDSIDCSQNETNTKFNDISEKVITDDTKCLQIDCNEKSDELDIVNVNKIEQDEIEQPTCERLENIPVEIVTECEQLPVISVTPSNATVINLSDDNNKLTSTTAVNQLNVEIVEVRKRHSNDCKTEKITNESVSSSSDHSNDPQISTSDDRRKSDKSKRRKGIYIQWPAIEKQKNLENDDWDQAHKHTISSSDSSVVIDPMWPQCEKRDQIDCTEINLADCDFSSLSTNVEKNLEKLGSGNIAWITCKTPDGSDTPASLSGSFEPTTPESDSNRQIWPTAVKSNRKPSLTCQSSEEKDDLQQHHQYHQSSPSKSNQKINLVRYESVSDNESDRTSPRERASQSPAPPQDQDLKRYSKRPLRGPYGQMLEAEMKKPAKVHYDEILEELNHRSERFDFYLTSYILFYIKFSFFSNTFLKSNKKSGWSITRRNITITGSISYTCIINTNTHG